MPSPVSTLDACRALSPEARAVVRHVMWIMEHNEYASFSSNRASFDAAIHYVQATFRADAIENSLAPVIGIVEKGKGFEFSRHLLTEPEDVPPLQRRRIGNSVECGWKEWENRTSRVLERLKSDMVASEPMVAQEAPIKSPRRWLSWVRKNNQDKERSGP